LDLFVALVSCPHRIGDGDDRGIRGQIVTIWSARPHCEVEDESSNNTDIEQSRNIRNDMFYVPTEVELPFANEEHIVDIQWLSPYPTILNSYPQFVLWTTERAVVYRLCCCDAIIRWNAVLDVQYCESWRNNSLLIASEYPKIIWPHLTSALQSLTANSTSKALSMPQLVATNYFKPIPIEQTHNVRSDWHPDVLVAALLLDPNGISNCVTLGRRRKDSNGKRNFVAGVIHWLSRWTHSEESERPLWENHVWNATEWKEKEKHEENSGIGSVVPLTTLNISSVLPYQQCNDATQEDLNADPEQVENAEKLMALLQMNTGTGTTKLTSNNKLDHEENLVRDLLDTLRGYLKSHSVFIKETALEGKKITSLANRPLSTNKDDKNVTLLSQPMLPRPIAAFNLQELISLYGIVSFYQSPPKIIGLDMPAKIALFSMELCRHIASLDECRSSSVTGISHASQGFRNALDEGASQKRATVCSFTADDNNNTSIASSAALCALVSSCQRNLLHRCISQLNLIGNKMDWLTARCLLIPFWLRDMSELRRVSEEIALNTFKSTRDVMECALLFVAMRKMTTLTNLARTDDTLSGKTFFKFLQNHNFSSDAGRKAAEKNAYSLLRKRRYGVAAAFFLLAEPPMLKTALEVIAGSMGDVGLALLVARLIHDSRRMPKIGGMYVGTGKSLSGFGGGGGFAAVSSTSVETESDEQSFCEWSPELDPVTLNTIRTHGLSKAQERNDAPLAALLYIWLGERDQATLSLASATNDIHLMFCNIDPRTAIKGKGVVKQLLSSFLGDVISSINSQLNFGSRYLILRTINAPQRAQWCSNLQIATVYSRFGIDFSSIIALKCLQLEDIKRTSEREKNKKPGNSILSGTEKPIGRAVEIAKEGSTSSEEMSSSIFDAFDGVPQKPKERTVGVAKISSSSGEMSSSIFDMFDSVPQKLKFKPPVNSQVAATTGGMCSSIFDSFDSVPPINKSKVKKSEETSSSETTSSIFDSFDPAPRLGQNISTRVVPTTGDFMPPVDPLLANENSEPKAIVVDFGELPNLWNEWKAELLITAVARRLLREVSRVCSIFHGDLPDPDMRRFRRFFFPLVPHGAAEVLSHTCDVDIITGLSCCIEDLSSLSGFTRQDIVGKAFQLLGDGDHMCCFPAPAILCSVILYSIVERADLAESIIANVSRKQIQVCATLGIANDEFQFKRSSKLYLSNQIMRRSVVQTSWQIELCLWLHRGGNIHLASNVLKEAIIAVRVGLLLGSWARCHETLESIIKCDPDCALDFPGGRQLWTCWKIMNNDDERKPKNSRCGGWEFLVDCKRTEATEMLRNKKTGTFLLRPHPDDHGVFTLSFKTNLSPTKPEEAVAKPILPDDVIQHAIVRLSDAGFRCGSFGPFGSLMKLLGAVSESLPFTLLFDEPPSEGIIKDKGEQPSPNSFLIRKLVIHEGRPNSVPTVFTSDKKSKYLSLVEERQMKDGSSRSVENQALHCETRSSNRKIFGIFTQLLAITEITKQLCAIFGNKAEDSVFDSASARNPEFLDQKDSQDVSTDEDDEERIYNISSQALRPLLEWRRTLEAELADELAPTLSKTLKALAAFPVAVAATDTAIEAIPSVSVSGSTAIGGDALIRRMIQFGSGVECRTLRVGEGWNSAMVVLFSRKQAIPWIVSSGNEKDSADALARLNLMEKERVIESLNLTELSAVWHNKKVDFSSEELSNVRYRFVDPWEVEPLESREAELAEIFLGRDCYIPFSVSTAARACEKLQLTIGGLELLSLWGTVKGGIFLTKAISSILPPWERDAGSDLQTNDGATSEPTPYISSVRKHLYRNYIFRSLNLPQRFLSLVQVELLDLKNLTAPGGTSNILAYSILRLKRPSSSATLSHKAKTLDCATTSPKKIGKSSGPLAPASWGCLVRFRYPLPEDVNCDGVSFDENREAIFKGPPSVLQLCVYEKKFMSDLSLGIADVSLDGLSCGGQLEEWVPLKAGKSGTTWFIRIRITLRFELMCIATENKREKEENSEGGESFDAGKISKLSVGMRKIAELSRGGGLHEYTKSVKRIESSPDFYGYFESILS